LDVILGYDVHEVLADEARAVPVQVFVGHEHLAHTKEGGARFLVVVVDGDAAGELSVVGMVEGVLQAILDGELVEFAGGDPVLDAQNNIPGDVGGVDHGVEVFGELVQAIGYLVEAHRLFVSGTGNDFHFGVVGGSFILYKNEPLSSSRSQNYYIGLG